LHSDILREAHVPLRGARQVVEEIRAALQSGLVAAAAASSRAHPSGNVAASLAPTLLLSHNGHSVFPDNDAVLFSEAAAAAASSIESASRLIENFLTIAEIQDGELVFEPEVISHFDTWLHECLAEFAPSLCVKRLVLDIYIEPGLPLQVVLDSQRLRQVLTYAVTNAIERSPLESTISVQIRSDRRTPQLPRGGSLPSSELPPTLPTEMGAVVWEERREEEGDTQGHSGISQSLSLWRPKPYCMRSLSSGSPVPDRPFLLVLVRDVGPAVSAVDAERLFSPSTQRYSDDPQRTLDLAACRGIVDMMGGTVGVAVASTRSLSNSSTIFWFDVPFSSPGPGHRSSTLATVGNETVALRAPVPAVEALSQSTGAPIESSATSRPSALWSSHRRRSVVLEGRMTGRASTGDIAPPFNADDVSMDLYRQRVEEHAAMAPSDASSSRALQRSDALSRHASDLSGVSLSFNTSNSQTDVPHETGGL
jgi:signal transduction histidine kinase